MFIFVYMGNKIIYSMVDGLLIILILIFIFMMIVLCLVWFGLFSIIFNLMFVVVIFGIWLLLVGYVNYVVVMIFSICLGFVVDDIIYFIS